MNLFKKQNHRQKTNLWLPKGKDGKNQEFGISRYTLLYIIQIKNKDLVYSKRNYVLYLVINYKGKEHEKECVYIYTYIYIYIYTHTHTTESLCCTPETKSIILQLKKKSYYVPGPKLNPVNNYRIESSQATI